MKLKVFQLLCQKSKTYSFIKTEDNGNKNAKRINENLNKNVTHGEYKNTLSKKKQIRNKSKRIQSKDID